MEKKPEVKKFTIVNLVDWNYLFEKLNIEDKLESEAFANYSIFTSNFTKEVNAKDILLNFNKSKFKDRIEIDRAIGSMMGLAIGDSLGHLLEFSELSYTRKIIKDFNKKYYVKQKDISNVAELKVGQWTDDTSQMLCLADSLIDCDGLDLIDFRKRLILWWHFGYNNGFRFDTTRETKTSGGRGGQTRGAMYEFIKNKGTTEITTSGDPEKSNSNGSLMRLCPVPIYYHDNLELGLKNSELQNLTTHIGIEAADCCKITAFFIILALNSPENFKSAKDFLNKVDVSPLQPFLKTEMGKCLSQSLSENTFKENPYNTTLEDRNWNWKDTNYKYSETRSQLMPGFIGGYVPDGLCMALHCLYHTKNLAECLLKITNIGGDSDTVGAIAGQIGGAIYGIRSIPKDWIKHIMEWDNGGEIALRAIMLYDKLNMKKLRMKISGSG